MSSLKPQLDEMGFRLFAVVHELKGVEQFKPFFDGEIYLDAEVFVIVVTPAVLHCVLTTKDHRT